MPNAAKSSEPFNAKDAREAREKDFIKDLLSLSSHAAVRYMSCQRTTPFSDHEVKLFIQHMPRNPEWLTAFAEICRSSYTRLLEEKNPDHQDMIKEFADCVCYGICHSEVPMVSDNDAIGGAYGPFIMGTVVGHNDKQRGDKQALDFIGLGVPVPMVLDTLRILAGRPMVKAISEPVQKRLRELRIKIHPDVKPDLPAEPFVIVSNPE